MVFDMGVHHTPRLQNLNKPLFFCTSTCITNLAFLLLFFNKILYFGHSFWWLHQDNMDLSKSWRAWTGVPAACGRPALEAGLYGLPSAWQELFLGEFPCTPSQSSSHLKHLAGEKEWVLGRANGLQDWVSWTGVHTGGPLSLLLGLMTLGLHVTWVWLGTFEVPVGRLSLLLGLHATWTSCHLCPLRTTCSIGWQDLLVSSHLD